MNSYNLKLNTLTELKKIEKKILTNIIFFFNIILLVVGFCFLVLNNNLLSVTHAKASESLPVVKFEIYSSLEVSIYYILVILLILNLLFVKINKFEPFKPYILSLTPLIGVVSIILLILSPHSMILNPSGWPPTRLESIELVGIIAIILFSLFIINSIFQIYLEGFMKNYLIASGFIIGALFLSDFIHESGHAIIILLTGGEITSFYPFPVLLGGEFNAGCVCFSNVPSSLIPLVLLGGEIFQWITICLLLFFFYVKPTYRKNIFLNTLLIIAFLDFPLYVINNSMGLPHWFLIGSTRGDIIIFSDLTNFPLWALIIIACIQLVIMILIFYTLFIRNREKNNKEAYKHI